MKPTLVLLLLSLLLCGCTEKQAGITNNSSPTVPAETVFSGLSAAAEAARNPELSAVTGLPLPVTKAYGIRMLGGDILVFSGEEQTTLTLLSEEDHSVSASVDLDCILSHSDPSLQFWENRMSFYREDTRQTVILDNRLREVDRIPVPRGIRGFPLLTRDGNTLFYCTQRSVMAWDRESDLHRCLKEMAYPEQTLAGLYLEDTVLQCRILDGEREENLFLSTQTGKHLHTHQGSIRFKEHNRHFFADFPAGLGQTFLFGTSSQDVFLLLPEDPTALCLFLEQQNSAVTVSQPRNGSISLSHYHLPSGRKTGSLSLAQNRYPLSFTGDSSGMVYFLVQDPAEAQQILYCWNCTELPDTGKQYTHTYSSARNPDLEGLARCQAYARQLSEKYGIGIKIGKDAAAVQPWDYDLEPEYQTGVLMAELKALDRYLEVYPKSMLPDTADHFSSLSICLVRQLTGTAESGSLDTAAGIQFLNGTDAYVVLAVGEPSGRTLYHELFHVMETHIWGNSIAFDQWEDINPAGFKYDLSYRTNKTRDSGVYLQKYTRAFVDTYSMSFPKEDRARIMEYAMLPEGEEIFRSPIMQRKLQLLCEGIREAYGLESSEETYLWEQYLQ